MAEARTFHLGDILSVTTGCLVSPDHIGGVYNLLGFMTNDTLFTHQLPRASDECRPALLAQHPQLADVQVPDFNGEADVWRWLAEQVDRFGSPLPVQPLPDGDHTFIDPFTELAMKRPGMPVVEVFDG